MRNLSAFRARFTDDSPCFQAFFLEEDYIRGCDYHATHMDVNKEPGQVHVIALNPFESQSK